MKTPGTYQYEDKRRQKVSHNKSEKSIYTSEQNKATQKDLQYIKDTVCAYFGINNIDIKTRKREIVQTRQYAMAMACKHTKNSLAVIGYYMGGKDHATVLHSRKTIYDLSDTDAQHKEHYRILDKKIKANIKSVFKPTEVERIEALTNDIKTRLNALKIANATNCEYYTILKTRLNDLQTK